MDSGGVQAQMCFPNYIRFCGQMFLWARDGTWPRTREEAALQFGYLDQPVIDKIARGNAIRLLGLDLPES